MEYSTTDKGEKKLEISDETITEFPEIKDIDILVCDGCTLLTSIPNIEGLEVLSCRYCTSLTSIPNIKGLIQLDCGDCTSLTSIPNIKSLKYLSCAGCTSLTSIPNIEGLEILYCSLCRLLISKPNIKGLKRFDFDGCPWIEPASQYNNFKPYQDRINKLIKLQRWFNRYLLSIKIYKFIPLFTEFWFSPYGPGCRAAIKRLNKGNKKLKIL